MIRRILILGAIILLVAAYIYHDERQKRVRLQQQTAEQVVSVAVSPVVQKTVVASLQAIGTVQPYATVSIKSQVDGQLLSVGFRAGQMVQVGQVLFTIDQRPFVAQLQKAQAELAHDEAQLIASRSTQSRYEKLAKKGYVSQQDLDKAQADALSAAAMVKADQAAVATAQLNLSYCTIKSPIEGRAGDVLVNVGNLVKTVSDTPLVTINQLKPIYVSFAIPEHNLLQVQQQHQSNTPIVVQAMVDKKISEQGTLTFINNTIDTATGNVTLKATFANDDQHLWPGRFVSVKLPLATYKDALIIPARAVQEGQEGPYVFVVKSADTVAYQAIKVGSTVPEGIIVREGLHAGEQVVVAGQLQLTDGAKIKIKS